jgi:hypothetical protein
VRSSAESPEISFLSEHDDGRCSSRAAYPFLQFAEEHSFVHDHSKGFRRGVEGAKAHKKDTLLG